MRKIRNIVLFCLFMAAMGGCQLFDAQVAPTETEQLQSNDSGASGKVGDEGTDPDD